jgi:predicted NBD/HSP70 family sugar kinase
MKRGLLRYDQLDVSAMECEFYLMTVSAPVVGVNAALCFDLGGTSIRGGVVTKSGRVLRVLERSSLELRDSVDFLPALSVLLLSLADALGVHAPHQVVLAVPGPVEDGRVFGLPTLIGAGAMDLNMAELARDCWPRSSIWICNDLTATGYGIAALGWRDFLVITCGSGIGAKLFIDGRPLLGRRGGGGEIGHWRVPGSRSIACDCGGDGHLGAIASGRGAERFVRQVARDDPAGFASSALHARCATPDDIDTRTIVACYRTEDPWVVDAMAVPTAALGACFAMVHLASGVEHFFVTGGFAVALGDRFGQRISQEAAAASWSDGTDWGNAIHIAPDRTHWGLAGGVSYAQAAPANCQVGDG